MGPVGELPTCWPSSIGRGSLVLCCRVGGSVDEVFHTMWISCKLAEEHHKARGDLNFKESAWVSSREARDAASWHEPGDPMMIHAAVTSHRYRKVRFESAPSALATKPFENQEMIQCNIHIPGKRYVLEAATTTSAPYGDKFTIYIRYIMCHETKTSCTLLITYAADWDPSMSFMMKPMVAKGVDVGLRSAFRTLRQVLHEVYPCVDITEQELAVSQAQGGESDEDAGIVQVEEDLEVSGLSKAASTGIQHASTPPAHEGHQPHAASFHSPSLLGFFSEQLVYRDQIPLLADVVRVGLRSISDQGVLARILAVLLTLSMISVSVSVIKAVQSLCHQEGLVTWAICFPLTHWLDVPDSTQEVLSALALVAVINWSIMKASQVSVAYLNQAAGASSASQQLSPQNHDHGLSHRSPTRSTTAHAAAAPGNPASGTEPSAPVSVIPVSDGTEPIGKNGGATSAPASHPGPPKKSQSMSPPVREPAPSKSVDPSKDGVKSSKDDAATAAQPPKPSKTPKPPALSTKPTQELPRASSERRSTESSSTVPQQLEMQCLSPPSQARAAAVAVAATGIAVAKTQTTTPEPSGTGDRPSSGSKTSVPVPAGAHSAAASSANKGGGAPGEAVEAVHEEPDTRSWMDSMADTFKGAWQKSQEPLIPFMAPSAECSDIATASAATVHQSLQSSSVAKGKLSSMSASATRHSYPGQAPPALPQGAYAPAAPVLGTKSPSLKDLVDGSELVDEEPDVVEEEVFENERFQPFRLWGHTWPGHFLPSDRVGHWSDRLDAPYGSDSMVFELVAPKLPNDGWRWLDPEWRLDMDGAEVESVDPDGWYYALDFNYLRRHPGSGKCNTHHFVRRRRWLRTRARIGMDASLPMPFPQTAHKDASESMHLQTLQSGPSAEPSAKHGLVDASVVNVPCEASPPSLPADAVKGTGGEPSLIKGTAGKDASTWFGMFKSSSPTGSNLLEAAPPNRPPPLQAPFTGSMDRNLGAAIGASLPPADQTAAANAAAASVSTSPKSITEAFAPDTASKSPSQLANLAIMTPLPLSPESNHASNDDSGFLSPLLAEVAKAVMSGEQEREEQAEDLPPAVLQQQ